MDVVLDGTDALAHLASTRYDVVVLDRDLPGVHGDEVCRRLVAERLRQSSAHADRGRHGSVSGSTALSLGADDYLPKPFDYSFLVASSRALGRRSAPPLPPTLTCGDIVGLEPGPPAGPPHDGQPLALTPKEFAVLECLLSSPGPGGLGRGAARAGLGRDDRPVHHHGQDDDPATMRADFGEPPIIETVREGGYRDRTRLMAPWAAFFFFFFFFFFAAVPTARCSMRSCSWPPERPCSSSPTGRGPVVGAGWGRYSMKVPKTTGTSTRWRSRSSIRCSSSTTAICVDLAHLLGHRAGDHGRWHRWTRPVCRQPGPASAAGDHGHGSGDLGHEPPPPASTSPVHGDEITELAGALDDLFARLEASFESQRHFVANASHELRTPLTTERTLLQVALADPGRASADPVAGHV